MEELFNGFGQYQTYVKYVFGKASATVSTVGIGYIVKFNPGIYNLKNEYKDYNSEFRLLISRIEVSGESGGKWYITERLGDKNHFNEYTIFSKEQINTILNCIKNSVAFAESHDNGVKNTVPKVKLMTRDEMVELYNKKELTPAEISLKSWELKRAYAVQNKCTAMNQFVNGSTCALCYNVSHTPGASCSDCALSKVHIDCNTFGSAYFNIDHYYGGKTDEFVDLIDTLIEKLKLAVQLEKIEKSVEKIKDIKKKLTVIVTPVKDNKVTLEIENYKLAYNTMKPKIYYLETSKEIAIRDKNGNYIRPVGCKYVNRDTDYISIGPNHPISIEAADEIIEGIKDAANHLHKTNHGECRGEHSCTDTIRRVHGVKITVKDVGDGKASISIDANGYDFDPDHIRCDGNGSVLWRSYHYPEYEWFVDGRNLDFTPSNRFNNGYVNSKKIIDKIVKYSIESIEYNCKIGKLRKQITEKQVIVV